MPSPPVVTTDDVLAFEQIEAAVKETQRGRWFLEEYARRNRHADTLLILGALERFEHQTRRIAAQASGGGEHLHGDILEMARRIAQTEREIRSIRPDGSANSQYLSASDELDSVVGTTEQATSSILSAAEKVQEHAWTMRERDGDVAECDRLDACATEIYTACAFQDVTAQRIRKVVGTLQFLDHRLRALVGTHGHEAERARASESESDAPSTPALRPEDIWMSDAQQAEIDDTFDFFVPAAASAEPTIVGAEFEGYALEDDPTVTMESPPAAEPAPKADPLATYAAMPAEEQLRRFR